MFETVVTLKPKEEWRKKKIEYKFFKLCAPFFHHLFHWVLPEERTITRQELIKEMDEALRIPGVANIWTQPIINRVDMLATGIRTSVGVKIFGTDLNVLQQLAIDIEKRYRMCRVLRIFTQRGSQENHIWNITLNGRKSPAMVSIFRMCRMLLNLLLEEEIFPQR